MKKVQVAVSFLVLTSVVNICQADCVYRLEGDVNKDCSVDFQDVAVMAGNWVVDCTASPLAPACHCNAPWVAEPPMNIGRDQFTGGVIGGKIYVFGGNGNPDQTNLKSTEGFDPATGLWTNLADNTHMGGWGVEEITGAVVDEKLYVFGGWGDIGPRGYYGVFNFNEKYDPVTNGWTTLAAKPTCVAAAPASVYNGEIYIWGGRFEDQGPAPNLFQYTVVEAYNPANNTWRTVTNLPRLMSKFGVATIGTKAYLFGGGIPDPLTIYDDVLTYDFVSGIWTTTGRAKLPVPMGFVFSGAAPVIDGKVYLAGGVEVADGQVVLSKRVEIYDPVSDTWEEGTQLPLPLDSHVVVEMGGKIYVVGGYNNGDFVNRSKAEVISMDTSFCCQ